MRLLSGYAMPVKALAVSADGGRLFTAAKGQTQVWEWDMAAGSVTRKLRGGSPVESLAVTPDGKRLVAALAHCGVVAWPLDGGEPRRLVDEPSRGRTAREPALSIHPAGRLVATPWFRGFLLLDLETAEKVRSVKGHASPAHTVAFSPDGALLAVADRHVVRLWDHAKARAGHELAHPHVPNALAFRPDGAALAVAAGRAVLVWDVASGRLLQTLAGQGGKVTALAYSPDGKYLAAAGEDGAVILRNALTHEVAGRRHLDVGPLGALCWLPGSRGLIAGGNRPIAVCELPELLVKDSKPKPRGEPLSLAGHATKVIGLSYSPDGRTLASASQGEVRFWDLSGGAGQAKEKQARPHFPRGSYWYGQMTWSPDGGRLALRWSGRFHVCDVRTGEVVRTFGQEGGDDGYEDEDEDYEHEDEDEEQGWRRPQARHLAFTRAGNLLFVRGEGAGSLNLSLLDAGSGAVLARIATAEEGRYYQVRSQTFGENDQRVYAVVNEHSVTRWTPATASAECVASHKGAKVMHLAVSDDERLLATVGAKVAHVWALPEGRKKAELKHPLDCTGAEFLPDGRLITSCYDGVVRVWDLSGGRELHAFDLGMGKVYCLAVSPDHMTFAAGVEKKNRIVLMDVPE